MNKYLSAIINNDWSIEYAKDGQCFIGMPVPSGKADDTKLAYMIMGLDKLVAEWILSAIIKEAG